jgi:hypothetical protein
MTSIVKPFGTPGAATYTTNFPAIQLNNSGFAGPFSSAAGKPQYPFGGFTRTLDALEAPFIGSYRLRRISGFSNSGALTLTNSDPSLLLELNPVTLDSQQADDYDTLNTSTPSDDPFENIGRFCPIDGQDTTTRNIKVDDFAPVGPPPTYTASASWRYHWALNLPTILTAESPQDEQFPLMDASFGTSGAPPQGVVHSTSGTTPAPQSYGQVATGASQTQFLATVDLNSVANYAGLPIQILTGGAQGEFSVISSATPVGAPGANKWQITLNPRLQNTPAQFDQFVILGPPEETASLNGLVNVNTASWQVLAGVPMVPNGGIDAGNNTRGLAQNANIAQSIVYYRDVDDSTGQGHGHGPFQSLFELNKVPIYTSFPPPSGTPATYTFRDAIMGVPNSCQTTSFNSAQGNYTATAGSNPIIGDFQGTFLMANRVSNLLTTHSDSFTAYVEIQGWQNAETSFPVLKVTRRATILIDRSKVTPVSQTLTITNVPVR